MKEYLITYQEGITGRYCFAKIEAEDNKQGKEKAKEHMRKVGDWPYELYIKIK